MKIEYISNHVKNDRIDRFMNIQQFFGIGEEYLTIYQDGKATVLTNTGIILIMSANKKVLITCYVATMKQAIAIYRNKRGNAKMPQWLYYKIIKNNKTVVQMRKDKMVI